MSRVIPAHIDLTASTVDVVYNGRVIYTRPRTAHALDRAVRFTVSHRLPVSHVFDKEPYTITVLGEQLMTTSRPLLQSEIERRASVIWGSNVLVTPLWQHPNEKKKCEDGPTWLIEAPGDARSHLMSACGRVVCNHVDCMALFHAKGNQL